MMMWILVTTLLVERIVTGYFYDQAKLAGKDRSDKCLYSHPEYLII